MERKVKICTLCAQTEHRSANYLKQKLSAYTEISEIRDFSDVASFAEGVMDCTSQGGAVIAAAPVSVFLKAKIRLMKSLSVKIVRSAAIVSAMGNAVPADSKEKDFQAALPDKATAVVSFDGLYSGFAKKSENNVLIFLPLDENRLEYMFGTGLDALFAKAFSKSAPNPAAKSAPAPASKAPNTGMSQIKKNIESVISNGKTVAISPVGCAKPLISAISAVRGCEEIFVADSAMRDRLEGESTEDHIAQCAKISKENAQTDLGIGISGIYADKSGAGNFVVVCVADSERAKAARVYANPGEDQKHLIAAAVIKLCEMLNDLSANGLINPNAPKNKKNRPKNSKLPIIIVAAVIAVAIIVCVVVAFVLGGKEDDASLTYAGQSEEYISNESNTIGTDDYYSKGGSDLDVFGDLNSAVEITETTGVYTLSSFSTVSTTVQRLTTTAATVLSTISTTAQKITTTLKTTTTTAATVLTTALKTTTTTAAPTTSTSTTHTEKKTETTKEAETTEKETTLSQTQAATFGNGSKGTFVFRVYGYGHGVGMSQDGAVQMAKDGSSYDKILTNYFKGTTVKIDSSTPSTVKYGGKEIPLVEYLCKTAKQEIGASSPTEALKAQIVCAYTYAKWYDFDVASSRHAYDSKFEYEGTNLHKACLELLGMSSDSDKPKAPYVDYEGKAAFTCYFANAAGKTASADSVWGGGSQYPYLSGGATSPEKVDVSTVEISAEDMKKLIEEYAEDNNLTITLDSDPAKWLEISEHDSAYDKNTGYVTTMRVGNYEMKGNTFRSYVVDYKLRSHCFTFEYISATEKTTTAAEQSQSENSKSASSSEETKNA